KAEVKTAVEVNGLRDQQAVAGECKHADQGGNGQAGFDLTPEVQCLQGSSNAVQKKCGNREDQRSHDVLYRVACRLRRARSCSEAPKSGYNVAIMQQESSGLRWLLDLCEQFLRGTEEQHV